MYVDVEYVPEEGILIILQSESDIQDENYMARVIDGYKSSFSLKVC